MAEREIEPIHAAHGLNRMSTLYINPYTHGGAAFVPTDIAGCILWLDADQITGLSDGDPVGTWSDSSGNGHDATQGTGTKKPTYKTSILNGLPVARFDGSDELIGGNEVWDALGSELTIFVVSETDNTSGLQTVFSVHQNPRIVIHLPYNGTIYFDFPSTAAGRVTAPQPVAINQFGIYSFVADSNRTIYHNGSQLAQVAGSGAATGSYPYRVGNDAFVDYHTGDIAEIIVYNSALSSENRSALDTHLNDKYAIY